MFLHWPLRVALACLALGLLPARCTLRADEAAQPAYGRHQFEDYERDHWSFVPVVRPALPNVERTSWVQTPIDAFLLAEMEKRAIAPAPPASPRTLLRRLYLDLVGLPPTPAEQQAFLADPSPAAYERVVDELLQRPEYGERWARHWLDVVRFAESNGYERDGAKPFVWRYRDWVIDALNADMPYDQFVILQLAGDEVPDSDAAAQTAATFLRLGPWDDEPADPMVDRYEQLDDIVGAVSAAFLGVTLRCARCHDHKFEPFKQADYTRVLAVFEPLKRPQNGRTDLDRFVGTPQDLQSFHEAMSAADTVIAQCKQQMDEQKSAVRTVMFREGKTQLSAEVISAVETPEDKRDDAQKRLVKEHAKKLEEDILAAAAPDVVKRLQELEGQIESTEKSRPPEPPRAYVWMEEPGKTPETKLFERGDPYRPQETVAPGLPAVLVEAPPPAPVPTASTCGRRLQLARWIAAAENPLTARVLVNRLWQHHFGDGLVSTENDFGVMGAAPSHPELLDWLAAELVDGGWRIKRLHKLIVMSNAFQTTAVSDPVREQLDPATETWWRWKPRRLEAEAVRDGILAASGQLNPAHGGPSVYPVISAAVMASQSRPGLGWKPSPATDAQRRSIYVFVKRTLPVPELEVLDLPSSESPCEQRMVSTIAPQALTYFNGEFVNAQAKHFAQRLVNDAGPTFGRQIERAFELTVCRPPTSEETAAAFAFLQGHWGDEPPAAGSAEYLRALSSLCVVLLNNNEFVYVE